MVIAYKYFNCTYSQISERFNFNRGTISKIINKFKNESKVKNRFAGGRPKVISLYPEILDKVK
jgi:transposase